MKSNGFGIIVALFLTCSTLLGQTPSNRELIERQIANYTRQIEKEPDTAESFVHRGIYYSALDEHDKSIADYDTALRLDPNLLDALNLRGIAHFRMHQLDAAIADFTEVLKKRPERKDVLLMRGMAHSIKGAEAEAIADYDAALKLDPELEMAYLMLGASHVNTENFEAAKHKFVQASKLNPQSANAYRGLAALYATCPDDSHRDAAKALEYATLAQRVSDPPSDTDHALLAAAYSESGDFANAILHQQKAVELAAKEDLDKQTKRLNLYRESKPARLHSGPAFTVQPTLKFAPKQN